MTSHRKQPALIIVQGFVGAGKTTFSKRLALKQGAIRINADEWCLKNFSRKELELDWDHCFSFACETLWQKAAEGLKQGNDVILDLGFWTFSSRENARNFAKDIGASFLHYYVYAPDDVLMDRLRQRKGVVAEKNLARFYEIKNKFEEPLATEQAIKIENY